MADHMNTSNSDSKLSPSASLSSEILSVHDSDSNDQASLKGMSDISRTQPQDSHQSLSNDDAQSLEEITRNELRKISLDQNGTFMVDFDPEKSQREMRKMNRRLFKKGGKKNQLYDDQGLMLEHPIDLCDCLEKECPGCHFPCARCESSKCGTECRCNRKYVIDFIEVEGTESVYNFPY